jgi:PRTRC genetic system protein B
VQAHVEIGEADTLELCHSVLVYTGSNRAFATLHDVVKPKEGAPLLGPAQPLTLAFLRTLTRGLGSQIEPEILPCKVLVRTPETIVWWSAASRRVMFFGDADEEAKKLDGRLFPHPALVFKAQDRELCVRALSRNARADATTQLRTAPYWNVAGDDGRVCLGTARSPEEVSVGSIKGWEEAFFNSRFTHLLGPVRLTSHPGGFIGLWRSLAGKKHFPARYLTDAHETLQEFVQRER